MPKNTSSSALTKSAALVGLLICQSLWLSGCAKPNNTEPTGDNVVEVGHGDQRKTIGEGGQKFDVLNMGQLNKEIGQGRLLSLSSLEGRQALLRSVEVGSTAAVAPPPLPSTTDDSLTADSLIVGFPVGLLSEQHLFGGVITKVTDRKNESLGGLKLTDLPPLQVKLSVSKAADNTFSLVLLGCPSNCTEGSALLPLMGIPIAAIDDAKGLLMLDLKPLGAELNLLDMMDPDGEATKLKTISSSVVSFDYSLSTLVFDIAVKMVPKVAPPAGTEAPQTTFTVRWYLRLTSVFDSAFAARPATDGVGFFMTSRAAAPKIQRFAIPNSVGTQTMAVKYYIKNVPEAHQAAFASAFDAWNSKFSGIIGKPLFTYEFVAAGSDKAKLLVAGDVRYKIIEWDLDNLASYGGLGPSIANQFTGEILTANILVQGPKVVELYTKWFGANTAAEALVATGQLAEAQALLKSVKSTLQQSLNSSTPTKHELRLGKLLTFRIPSEMQAYEDAAAPRDDFEPLPAGITYEKYMLGYFHDMLTHEMGHNVGLRHNFRGNLAFTALAPGQVSNSVMEYLGRNFRYLDDVGGYDIMALEYGYRGTKPPKLGLFCTDENVATDKLAGNSPECSRDDATADPFGYFDSQIGRIVGLLTLKGSAEAPVWTVPDMDKEIKSYFTGTGLYAARSETTGASWTNFFTGGDRPNSPAGVKAYVLARFKARLCGPELDAIIAGKATAEGKQKTQTNLVELRKKVADVLKPLSVYTEQELLCTP